MLQSITSTEVCIRRRIKYLDASCCSYTGAHSSLLEVAPIAQTASN
jgi:hypothetical protein